MKRFLLSFILIGAVIGFTGVSHAGFTFTTFDAPNMNYYETQVTGIDGEKIVGYFGMGDTGFVYDGVTFTPFGWPGAEANYPQGISGNKIVGWHGGGGGTAASTTGFIYDGVTMTAFNVGGPFTVTLPNGIEGNNIVGSYSDADMLFGPFHGFLYDGATAAFFDYPGAVSTEAHGISGNNIVGTYVDAGNASHGFLYDGKTFTTLDFPGAVSTVANGINGERIVGTYTDAKNVPHGFLYDGKTFTTLDYPDAVTTHATGISGDRIVGWYTPPPSNSPLLGGPRGFIATMLPAGNASLTVIPSGSGTGTLTSSPPGIDCGATCSAGFKKGKRVSLIPAPDSGSVFTGWTGGCKGSAACSVTMSKDITVGADFETGSCTYYLSSGNKTVSYRKSAAVIAVTATGHSYCPPPDIVNATGWITSTAGTFTNNHGSIKLVMSELDSSIGRTGTITIGGKSFTVHQTGEPCTLILSSPSSPLIPRSGGSGSFNVTVTPADCAWTAAPGSFVTWVHATTSGAEVDYTVDENTGKAARTGYIAVILTVSKTGRLYRVKQGNK